MQDPGHRGAGEGAATVSAAGAAEGLGLPAGSRKHCSWGVVGWTSVALTADLWTVKQQMFSLGGNLTLLPNSRTTVPAEAGAHRGQCARSFHAAPCSVISSLGGQEVKTRSRHLRALRLPVTPPLSMCACAHARAPRVGRTQRAGGTAGPGVCMEPHGLPCPALPPSLCSAFRPFRSLAGQRGPLGCALPPRTLLTRSHRPPQGLPELAGAGSLKACELTLGTELQGTSEQSWQG